MRPLDNSACFEANEGKSSPKSQDLAFGRGNSARFILDLFIDARTLCHRKIDRWVFAEPKRQRACSRANLISSEDGAEPFSMQS